MLYSLAYYIISFHILNRHATKGIIRKALRRTWGEVINHIWQEQPKQCRYQSKYAWPHFIILAGHCETDTTRKQYSFYMFHHIFWYVMMICGSWMKSATKFDDWSLHIIYTNEAKKNLQEPETFLRVLLEKINLVRSSVALLIQSLFSLKIYWYVFLNNDFRAAYCGYSLALDIETVMW